MDNWDGDNELRNGDIDGKDGAVGVAGTPRK